MHTTQVCASYFWNKTEAKDNRAASALNARTARATLVQSRLALPSDASSTQMHPPCFQLMLSETGKTEIKWRQKQVAFRKLINYGLRQRQEERRVELGRLCQALSFIIHYKKMNGGSLWSTWEWGGWLVPKTDHTRFKMGSPSYPPDNEI